MAKVAALPPVTPIDARSMSTHELEALAHRGVGRSWQPSKDAVTELARRAQAGSGRESVSLLLSRDRKIVAAFELEATALAKAERYNSDPMLEPELRDFDAPYSVETILVTAR